MKGPLVSIVVPTYNRANYLKFTLDSLVGQTYRPIEIIVIDDGTEGTANAELCESYEEVRYKKIENSGGPARPRNVGSEMANGYYMAWVDDDDIWMPTKLEKQVAILEDNPEYGLVHGPCEVIDPEGERTSEIIGRPGSLNVKHGDVRLKMMGNWTLMMPTPLLRAELLKDVGSFNEKIPAGLEDVEFWVRCSFHTSFYYLDEPLVEYRVHSGNISSDTGKYLKLPLYLNECRKELQRQNQLKPGENRLLMRNLGRMQLKMLRLNPGLVVGNMFRLDPVWFLKLNNLKVFIKKALNR